MIAADLNNEWLKITSATCSAEISKPFPDAPHQRVNNTTEMNTHIAPCLNHHIRPCSGNLCPSFDFVVDMSGPFIHHLCCAALCISTQHWPQADPRADRTAPNNWPLRLALKEGLTYTQTLISSRVQKAGTGRFTRLLPWYTHGMVNRNVLLSWPGLAWATFNRDTVLEPLLHIYGDGNDLVEM